MTLTANGFRRAFLATLQVGVISVFGLIVPIVLCIQAHASMSAMEVDAGRFDFTRLSDVLPATKAIQKPSSLDYTFAALLLMESSSRHIMLSKQRMKMAVMQVGFAVISIGIMFIFLGIDAGGIDATGTLSQGADKATMNAGFSLKVASTGLVAFLIGASMVAAGGLLKNEYISPEIPVYAQSGPIADVRSGKSPDEMKREFQKLSEQCIKESEGKTPDLKDCLNTAAAYAADSAEK